MVGMFNNIYGHVHSGLPVEVIALHFIEEVGEVANSIRLISGGSRERDEDSILVLEWEIADVFSWICNLTLRVGHHFDLLRWYAERLIPDVILGRDPAKDISLSSVLWNIYAGPRGLLRCPGCRARPCSEDVPEADAKSGIRWYSDAVEAPLVVIAIDGPSGSGKSTVGKMLAKKTGLVYINSGAMYRAAALKVLEAGVNPDDELAVGELMENTVIKVSWDDYDMRVFLEGRDVSDQLRKNDVESIVAKVSANPAVREKLVSLQRTLLRGGAVVEGRDIGTVVSPNAPVKIFLNASPEERARRRVLEGIQNGSGIAIEQTSYEIGRRDRLDAERKISPLVAAVDAVEIDSTHLTAAQVVEQILDLVVKKGLAGERVQ